MMIISCWDTTNSSNVIPWGDKDIRQGAGRGAQWLHKRMGGETEPPYVVDTALDKKQTASRSYNIDFQIIIPKIFRNGSNRQ